MKPSDELFHLIKSLTKSEKRYFKLLSSLQSGEKNYVKLFDAIESQPSYDEEKIKDTFAQETFIDHLPSEKNHLYGLILKSLRNFHSDRSVKGLMQEEIKNIELLYSKALYKECGKIVRKAKNIAHDHEEFYYLLELIDWQRILIEEGYSRGKFNQNIDKLIEEEELVLEKLRNLAEYQILYSKINYVFRKGGFTRNEKERKMVDEIMHHHLIIGKDTAISLKASTACFYIQGLCAWTNRDMELAFKNFEEVMLRFKKNPLLINELPKRYTRVLNHQLLYYIETGKFEQFYMCLGHMKALAKKPAFHSTDLQIRIFTFSTIAQLLACQQLGDYTHGEQVVQEIVKGIKKYHKKISKEDIIVYYYNISRHYVGSGNYKKALEYINKVLNDNEANLRQDLFVFARLLNLVIHYELENFDLLDYLIKSTSRYIKKKHREYEYETAVVKYMKRMVRAQQARQSPDDIMKEFKNELNTLYKNPHNRIRLEYFDILEWIEIKMGVRSKEGLPVN
ncbi:MAG: hypothetical protein RIE58_03135 [Vicingaceae bacterium]